MPRPRVFSPEEVRDRNKARSKAWREANPTRARDAIKCATLRKKYGVTLLQFNSLLSAQNNKCRICSSTVVSEGRNHHNRAVLDHCHTTGKVRGILCHMCNAAIGLFREDKELIIKAQKYLEGAL